MNAAYKWYRYNNNIIQFYSDSSCSGCHRLVSDRVKETVEQACNYASSIIETNNEININFQRVLEGLKYIIIKRELIIFRYRLFNCSSERACPV